MKLFLLPTVLLIFGVRCVADVNWLTHVLSFNEPYLIVDKTLPRSATVPETPLVDVFRGGHSNSLYEYVLFRQGKSTDPDNVEIVFFNREGDGFVSSVEMTPDGNGSARLQLKQTLAGEFGRLYIDQQLTFKFGGHGTVLVTVTTVRRKLQLFMTRIEQSENAVELQRVEMQPPLLARALSIQFRIEIHGQVNPTSQPKHGDDRRANR